MKIPDANAALNKERNGKSSRLSQAWNSDTVKSTKEVILEAQREKKNVHFATLMGIRHIKHAELEPTLQKYKGRVVLRGDIVKIRLWRLCSFY